MLNSKSNELSVAEGDPKTLDWNDYGTHEEWVRGFKIFANRKYNKKYGFPVDRSRLLVGWKHRMTEEANIAYEKSKAKS